MLTDSALVEKSKQLIWSRYSQWSAGELAVFDTYLSRINARNPESSEVVFSKKEYEELLGLSKIRPDQLNRYVRKFTSNSVEIRTNRGWIYYALFDKASLVKNPETGEWEVTLRCHPELKDAFFSLAGAGYQQYRLKYTLSLKSKYSKLLYCLLKDCLYRGSWIVDLQELRDLLGASEASWKNFKEFNRRILKVAQDEICQHTDLDFEYEKILRGRTVKAISFKIRAKNPSKVVSEQLPGQQSMEDDLDPPQQPTRDTRLKHRAAEFVKAFPSDSDISEGQAYSLAKLVYLTLRDTEELSTLDQEQLELATACALQSAYKRYVAPRYKADVSEWPNNPGAYLYSILQHEAPAEYVSARIFTGDLSVQPKWPNEQ